jgi:uncharacterized protein (TIGR03086 family)
MAPYATSMQRERSRGQREAVTRGRIEEGVSFPRSLDNSNSFQHYLNLGFAEVRRGCSMTMDSVVLFDRAATNAAVMVEQVRSEQRHAPTPCTEWDVDALIVHMAGGAGYLLGALGLDAATVGTDPGSYRGAVARGVESLREPGALDGRCLSPAGFEWSVAEAAAGTAMDQLVHTWDLAVAIGGDRRLDPEIVDAVMAMFVPQMPEIGRAAGIVGPEVSVPAGASAQDRLLGAMGRHP